MNELIKDIFLIFDSLFLLTIFMGSLYIAIHNNTLPKWHVTPLWYAGCICLFLLISIWFDMIFGKDFEFSYGGDIRIVGRTLLDGLFASLSFIYLYRTYKKYIESKKDQFYDEQTDIIPMISPYEESVKKKSKTKIKNMFSGF